MAALIIGATVAAMWACDMSAIDSFYFVVQTLWTVGYGDVTPSGEEGRIIAIAVMLFGTVGITSALGVVGGMILDRHAKRHDALEKVEGVESVDVSLENKNAVISASESVTDDALRNAVTEAGYEVTGIEG